ncbi:hypothetical protein CDD83_1864 [Cordyceps sp. RAO-2017]|nr:hypothetical protein CDD83_1864 [Cordyceps sp. RAO-2017]
MAGKKNKQKKQSGKGSQSPTRPLDDAAASASRPDASPVGDPLALSGSHSKSKDSAPTPVVGPGGFPGTPTSEDDRTVGVSPLPAAPGATNPVQLTPGEKVPGAVAGKGLDDNVRLDRDSYDKAAALPGAPAFAQPHSSSQQQTVGVNPLPAADGALNPIQLTPGQKIPDAVSGKGLADNVKLDKDSYDQSAALPGVGAGAVGAASSHASPPSSQTVGVNPLPAAPGALNPVELAPGDKIPESVSTQGLHDNVRLDKDSYEKSNALPGMVDTQLPPVSKNMIPESSLPIVGGAGLGGAGFDPTINSVGPDASTVPLAAAAPLEAKVPEMVKESQSKAGFAPEASAVPEEVEEKSKIEKEFMDKVHKAPTTSEGTAGSGGAHRGSNRNSMVAGGVAAGGTAAAGGAALAAAAAKKAYADKASPAVNDMRTAASGAADRHVPDSARQRMPEPAQNYLAGQTDGKSGAREPAPSNRQSVVPETRRSPEPAAGRPSPAAEQKRPEPDLSRDAQQSPAETNYSKPMSSATRPDEFKGAAEQRLGQSKPEGLQGLDDKAAENWASDANAAVGNVGDKASGAYDSKVDATKGATSKLSESGVDEAKALQGKAGDVKSEAAKGFGAESAEANKLDQSLPAGADSAKSKAADAKRLDDTKPTDNTKPTESKPTTDAKPSESKPAESASEAGKAQTSPEATNGADSKPPGTANGDSSTATPEKKKKNRLSTIFSKIKGKLSDKK